MDGLRVSTFLADFNFWEKYSFMVLNGTIYFVFEHYCRPEDPHVDPFITPQITSCLDRCNELRRGVQYS